MPSIIKNNVVYTNSTTITSLTDTTITNPTSGQSLVYDATSGKWVNGEGAGKVWTGTQAQYDAIVTPDPDTTYYITDGVANGYQLWKGTQAQYDAITTPDDNTIYCITDSQDVTIDLSDLGDTNISSPSAGQIIQYGNNGKWANASVSDALQLSALGDTSISAPLAGQVLTYDSNGKWANSNIIDDTTQTTTTTWSSDKIYNEVKKAYGGTVTASSGATIRGQHLYKRDNIIYLDLTINFTTAITDGNRSTIANIPDGFRPPNGTISFVCSGSSNINYYANRMATVLITQGGDILLGDGIWPSGTSVKELSMCISYFV